MVKHLVAKFETPAGVEEVRSGDAVLGYIKNGSTGRSGKVTARKNERLKANARFQDTERVMEHLFGGPADTDDADQFLEPYAAAARYKLLQAAMARGDTVSNADLAKQIIPTCRYWFPRIPSAEIDAVVARVITQRIFYKAARLGEIYRITDEVRQRLDLRTIRAIDVSPQQASRQRKDKDAERAARNRRNAGAMTIEARRARSITKLAMDAGRSRKTIYEWQKLGILDQKLAELGLGNTCVRDKGVALTIADGLVTSAEKKSSKNLRPGSQMPAFAKDEGRALSPPPPSSSPEAVITPTATIEDRLLDHHGATGELIDLGGRMFIRFRVPSLVLEVVDDAIAMFPPQEGATSSDHADDADTARPRRIAAKGSRR